MLLPKQYINLSFLNGNALTATYFNSKSVVFCMRVPQFVKDVSRSLRHRISDRTMRRISAGPLGFRHRVHKGEGFEREKIARAMNNFGLKRLILVHGIAVTRRADGIVMVGPPGIGKSTVLRRASRRETVQPIDDGLIVIGEKEDGKFVIIETGTYGVDKKRSLVSKALRKILRFKTPYREADISREKFERDVEIGYDILNVTNLISGLFLSGQGRIPPKLKMCPLKKLVSVEHPKDTHAPVEVYAGSGIVAEQSSGELPKVSDPTYFAFQAAYEGINAPAGMVRTSNKLLYRDARKRGIGVIRLNATQSNLEKRMLEELTE